MQKLRVLGVGAGYFSQFQYLGWQRIAAAQCVAIVNRDRVKAQALAERFDVPRVYQDFDAALAAEQPDLVDLITPPETHREFVSRAVAHGVPVICQKPFG
ncbi:MAG: Gfo/Idh/MocA family oxidoreductase, partial [Rubrivivax sp.]